MGAEQSQQSPNSYRMVIRSNGSIGGPSENNKIELPRLSAEIDDLLDKIAKAECSKLTPSDVHTADAVRAQCERKHLEMYRAGYALVEKIVGAMETQK